MKSMIMFFMVLLFGTLAHASFQGFDGTTNLKVFNQIRCSTGIKCTRVADRFVISTSGGLPNRIAATATTLTASQCGSIVHNTGAVQINLPDADLMLGCFFQFTTLNASNFDIDPDAADRIFAITDANGDKIRNATVGNSVGIRAVPGGWVVTSIYGTWTDAN